jgi:hypothetical protein
VGVVGPAPELAGGVGVVGPAPELAGGVGVVGPAPDWRAGWGSSVVLTLRRSYLSIVLRCATAQLADEPHFSRPYLKLSGDRSEPSRRHPRMSQTDLTRAELLAT